MFKSKDVGVLTDSKIFCDLLFHFPMIMLEGVCVLEKANPEFVVPKSRATTTVIYNKIIYEFIMIEFYIKTRCYLCDVYLEI